MRDYSRFASLGVVVGTDHNGRVKHTSILRELLGPIKYRMTDADLDVLKRGMTAATQVYWNLGPVWAVVVGLSVGIVVGLVNGLLIVVARIPDLLATLGTMFVFAGLALLITAPAVPAAA